MRNLISTYVLSANSGWLENIFSGIRITFQDASEVSVVVAVELAAIFCVIKLVGLASKIMSDNQMGGYGSIDVNEIIRPLVLFFLVQAFVSIVVPLDTVCDTLSTKLAGDAKKVQYDPSRVRDVVNESIRKVKELEIGLSSENPSMGAHGLITSGISPGSAASSPTLPTQSAGRGGGGGAVGAVLKAISIGSPVGLFAELVNGVFGIFGQDPVFQKTDDGVSLFGSFAGVIATLFYWLGQIFFYVERIIVYAMSNIYLAFLAFFGPLAFAFSIMDKWSQSYLTWIATYIEVSMWKVGVSVIEKAVNIAASCVATQTFDTSFGSGEQMFFFFVGNAGTEKVLVAIVFFCGLKCLKSLPAMIHMAIAITGESSGANVAGSVAGSVTQAGQKVAQVGGQVVTGL